MISREIADRIRFDRLGFFVWAALRSAFLVFLVFSILNISVGGNSFYFFMLVPFLDAPFLGFLARRRWDRVSIFLLSVVLLTMTASFLHRDFAKFIVKPGLLFIVVLYARFLRDFHPRLFRLVYALVAVSVAFALVQLASVFLGFQDLVYPTSIARMIWGGLAIDARPGFEDGIIFPVRVAGLSKEPGFFSSLLLVVAVLAFKDGSLGRRAKRILLATLAAGILLSFSKITLVFVMPALGALAVRRWMKLDRIPLILGSAMILATMGVLVNLLYERFGLIRFSYLVPYFVLTYLHRTIGYYLLSLLSETSIASMFVVGGVTQRLDEVLGVIPFLHNLPFVSYLPDVVFFSSSYAYLAFQYGVLFFFAYFLFLARIGVKFFDSLIFFLLVSSVNPLAFENFVILGYLILLPSFRTTVPAKAGVPIDLRLRVGS